ncbi:MAG: RNA polymerase sigma factor [Sporocytophaga sp.]|uniref:RNA polymerase sigma factor n=1 Tax=Sporocytophaga sp. TaxID=2231183 RepID=UPI001B25DC24|nr:RNA polymerase sigma factor [Sporocytophaga sp.]MBO9703228.1 RNA polymerase sigma factor [Sporocytophaga sp.]
MVLSDNDIVRGCAKGDLKSQEALFKKYGPELKKLSFRYSKSVEDAKDIFQEAFIKIFKDINSFRNEGALIGWMKRVTVNTAISFYRKKSNSGFFHLSIEPESEEELGSRDSSLQKYFNETEEIEDEDFSEYEKALSKLSYEQLINLIKSLDPPQNIIFNMFYVENYSHKEIARELKISENNCRTLLHRSKKKLKDSIRVLIYHTV